MGNIVTDGSTAGWLPDAKIADPDRTLDHPEWQISHDDFNDLTSAADVIASHLCGEPDGSGAWFLGGYAQTADPLTATLAGLGTGRWHMWPDSTDDAWKFRESGETAERLIFDDQGLGVLKLDSYAGATLSPAGKTWIRSNAGTLQYSYNGGAWAALGGGGLSSPVGAADGGTGITSYAVGDIIYASGATTLSKLADVATGNALISGGVTTAPAWGKIGLTTHVSGTLPVANGGTAIASYAVGDLIQASGATTLSALAAVATGNVLLSGGVTTVSAWGKVGLTTHVSGTLPAANGGTGQGGGYAVGDMLYASGASALSKLAAVAAGQVLISAGTTTAPAYSASPVVTDITVGGVGASARIGAWATDTKIVQIGGTSATASYRGITGVSGAGTDKVGGDLRLQGGVSTGAAAGGDVEIWHPVRTTPSDAVENTAVMTWEFTAPTDVGDGTGVAQSDLLPAVTAKNYLGSTSKRLISGYFDTQCFANIFGSADDTNTNITFDESDGISFTFGGTSRVTMNGSRTVWTYGGATPETPAHIGEWYTDAAEGRFKVQSQHTSGYGGFIAKGSDANKILSMAVYGASTAGTTLGVTNASLAEIVSVATNMVIYTTGTQSLSLGTNSSANPVIQLGSTANTLGFYGVTPVARASAYTQTYSTAARTVTSGMTVDQLAQIVNSLIDDLQAYGLAQ